MKLRWIQFRSKIDWTGFDAQRSLSSPSGLSKVAIASNDALRTQFLESYGGDISRYEALRQTGIGLKKPDVVRALMQAKTMTFEQRVAMLDLLTELDSKLGKK